MINKVILVGRVGNDPKQSGAAVKVSLATSEKTKDANGMFVDRTEWHTVTFFGKLGDVVMQYVSKGTLLYVEGKIRMSKYQDKNNQERLSIEIVGNVMQILSPKNNSEKKSINGNKKIEYNPDFNETEDLPF